MLWVWFDRQGVAKCVVNVGNKIRQGDSFKLAIYVEGANEGDAQWEVLAVEYMTPNSVSPSFADGLTLDTRSETFSLGNPSQANYYFKDGQTYEVWECEIPSEATDFPGNGGTIGIKVTLTDDASSSDGSAQKRMEIVSQYVEPTYGNKPTRLTDGDYSRLLRLCRDYFYRDEEGYLCLDYAKIDSDRGDAR